jgi:hypothetical protein
MSKTVPEFCTVKFDGEVITQVVNGATIVMSPNASLNYVNEVVKDGLYKFKSFYK